MRYHGNVGFGVPVETSPGVHEDVIVEREYFGDVARSAASVTQGENLNKDVASTSTVRIVPDAYAREHILGIRYVEWAGILWAVSSADMDPERPRLLLQLGEVYNGPTDAAPESP